MIVVLGDINVDISARLELPPRLGSDCLAPELGLHLGGVGANTAIALSRLGEPVRLVACAGRDGFAEFALARLTQEGIDLSFVQRTDVALTGVMFIAIAPDGQRTILGSRSANLLLRAGPEMERALDGARALHLMGYSQMAPVLEEAATILLRGARERGVPVSVDAGAAPSHQVPEKVVRLGAKADLFFANAEEASAITAKGDPPAALEALEESGIRKVVVKLGESGCLLRQDAQLVEVPPLPVRAVDTTGAGDSFTAAFLKARLDGWPDVEAALLANAAGAAASEVVGAADGMPATGHLRAIISQTPLPGPWNAVRRRVLDRLKQESNATPRTKGA
ncbi:MAG: sugar kinase [Acidobacteria bacterium]|nr:sugar kinase [Acidobacteriota bacterium]